MKTWLIRLSVLCNVLVLVAALAFYLNVGNLLRGFMADNYDRKVTFFDEFPVGGGDTVFLGDSITDGSEWQELFPGVTVKNRGIGGDTTTGVLKRLHQIYENAPARLFLMIGTNDLTHGPNDREDSYRQYREIVDQVREHSPETEIYLQSMLPRKAKHRSEVEAYNQQIESIAAETDATYIDLYPHFLAEDGSIIDEYSNDELHLNGSGYKLWRGVIVGYLTHGV